MKKSGDIGGISKTINYKGNSMDIGGHRFFSKSDRVMSWWLNILPLQNDVENTFSIQYQNKSLQLEASQYNSIYNDPDKIMLVRKRRSRIYSLRKFFPYPISLSIETLRKLGIGRYNALFYPLVSGVAFPLYRNWMALKLGGLALCLLLVYTFVNFNKKNTMNSAEKISLHHLLDGKWPITQCMLTNLFQ